MSSHWKQHDEPLLIAGPKRRRGNDDDDDDDDDAQPAPCPQQMPPSFPPNLIAMMSPTELLKQTGACIIADPFFVNNVAMLSARFDEALQSFPEYRRNGPRGVNPRYVLGGFAALGNAGSWHNSFVRWVRLHAMRAVYPLFGDLTRERHENFSQIADRMLFRPAGEKPMADTWHRDVKKNQISGETIYGGWLNTTDKSQFLSCVLGTHNDVPDPNDPQGFEKITNPACIREYEARKVAVEVKPGEILVFREEMVHEVLPKVHQHDVKRVFLAWMTHPWRKTKFPDNIIGLLEKQAVIKLKSDQNPRMYPRIYRQYPNLTAKLEEWGAQDLVPAMLMGNQQPNNVKYKPGQQILLPMPEAPSLVDAGLPLYPPYAQHEIDVFFTSRSHMLPRQVGSQELALQSLN